MDAAATHYSATQTSAGGQGKPNFSGCGTRATAPKNRRPGWPRFSGTSSSPAALLPARGVGEEKGDVAGICAGRAKQRRGIAIEAEKQYRLVPSGEVSGTFAGNDGQQQENIGEFHVVRVTLALGSVQLMEWVDEHEVIAVLVSMLGGPA
jgi:hypothetical protein